LFIIIAKLLKRYLSINLNFVKMEMKKEKRDRGSMQDFLTFNSFVTPHILIFFYYIGAVGVPLFLWFSKDAITKKVLFLGNIDKKAKNYYKTLSYKNRLKSIVLFFLLFFFLELFLRMMFEMMIGYFDMHDYLYKIAENLH